MRFLGINAVFHDSSAALVVDGRTVTLPSPYMLFTHRVRDHGAIEFRPSFTLMGALAFRPSTTTTNLWSYVIERSRKTSRDVGELTAGIT